MRVARTLPPAERILQVIKTWGQDAPASLTGEIVRALEPELAFVAEVLEVFNKADREPHLGSHDFVLEVARAEGRFDARRRAQA